jgi:RNA polymerase sigma-70 factor (ECF subfamily)
VALISITSADEFNELIQPELESLVLWLTNESFCVYSPRDTVRVETSEVFAEALDREFEEIFREHHHMAYRTARGVLGNPTDAEDIVQTIFLRLLDRGISSDIRRNPRGYLYRAAVNESLNLIRSRKRLVLVADQDRIEAHAAPEAVESPVASEDEIHRRLYEAISRLSAGWAEMLILRYVHKSSDAEIAKLLGKSRGTVAVTLYRARARLKKWMSDSLGGKS